MRARRTSNPQIAFNIRHDAIDGCLLKADIYKPFPRLAIKGCDAGIHSADPKRAPRINTDSGYFSSSKVTVQGVSANERHIEI